MKIKTMLAFCLTVMLATACVLEGVTAGAVLGFIANNAVRAGEAAGKIKTAIEKYKESEKVTDKVEVLADVTCHVRLNFPEEMVYLRGKLSEAGIKPSILEKARKLADKKCDTLVQSAQKKPI